MESRPGEVTIAQEKRTHFGHQYIIRLTFGKECPQNNILGLF